jgi:hypothetical protein
VTGFAQNDLTNTRNNFVWQLDSSFSEIARYEDHATLAPVPSKLIAGITDGKGGPKKTVAWLNNLDILEWTTAADTGVPEGAITTPLSTKAIDISSHITGTIQDAAIYSFVDVTGIPELHDGLYVFVRIRTTTVTNRFYILRIEEETTTWSVHGVWSVRPLVADFTLAPNHLMGLLVMPAD